MQHIYACEHQHGSQQGNDYQLFLSDAGLAAHFQEYGALFFVIRRVGIVGEGDLGRGRRETGADRLGSTPDFLILERADWFVCVHVVFSRFVLGELRNFDFLKFAVLVPLEDSLLVSDFDAEGSCTLEDWLGQGR